MVVCRLRRNVDFRPNENASRASQGRRYSSTTHNGNYGIPGGGIDHTGVRGRGKAVESSSKKCSSSYDSHSVEQNDSASEAERKQSNGFVVAESSSLRKPQDSEDEEDCYADILKDDIIKLDESALSSTLDTMYMAVNGFDSDRTCHHQSSQLTTATTVPSQGTLPNSCHHQPLQPTMTTIPIQGTAYQRIKLKNRPPGDACSRSGSIEARKCPESVNMVNEFKTRHCFISTLLVILTWLVFNCLC